jgi:predicted alpha/beta hydrolase family esterase
MKGQLVTIGGGDSFSKRENFLLYLENVPLREPLGVSRRGWRSSLSEKISDREVFTISMPNKENARYDEWCIWFERHLQFLTGNVVLVGSSLGGMFIAKYLIENKVSFNIVGLFLLAAPCGYYDDEGGNDCSSFSFRQEDLQKLYQNVQHIEIWHSKDDFVVPYEHALLFKKYLPDAKLVTFSDKNHFLLEEFPELVEAIEEVG